MKALHFGSGNIGRGLVVPILQKSDYEVYLADVDTNLIQLINKFNKYRINIIGNKNRYFQDIFNVKCIDVNSHYFSDYLFCVDLVTISVGVNNLYTVAIKIVNNIIIRFKKNHKKVLNIIVCENIVLGGTKFKKIVLKMLPLHIHQYCHNYIGFIDSCVDRIIPLTNHNNDYNHPSCLDVSVEPFYEWVIDQKQYKGCYKHIVGIVKTKNLSFFLDRKFFILNTGHAILAYFGLLHGYETTYQAINDMNVKNIVQQSMKESMNVLNSKYNQIIDKNDIYISSVFDRFNNKNITDYLLRIGRNPINKLKKQDRLIKPIIQAIQFNLSYKYLLYGVASALMYKNIHDNEAIKLQNLIKEYGISLVLYKVSEIDVHHYLNNEIVYLYNKIKKNI
ncbi:mannitol-1-phosphate 5-dehydrogenase [Buchnera aphidicola]|nr:mannitol-1-phosphate 5-dehydrogenase [Buchnera aphidicola]